MPYLNNPGGIQYTWGVPCTFLDFECYHEYRKKKFDLNKTPKDLLDETKKAKIEQYHEKVKQGRQ